MSEQLVLVPYDPDWVRQFEQEAARIGAALGDGVLARHLGSTAIPGVSATRPILDLLVELRGAEGRADLEGRLVPLAYVWVGEHGIPGRPFLIRHVGDRRSHNLFALAAGHPAIQDCLSFRDYLITHQAEAALYSLLKQDLAARHEGMRPACRAVLRRKPGSGGPRSPRSPRVPALHTSAALLGARRTGFPPPRSLRGGAGLTPWGHAALAVGPRMVTLRSIAARSAPGAQMLQHLRGRAEVCPQLGHAPGELHGYGSRDAEAVAARRHSADPNRGGTL